VLVSCQQKARLKWTLLHEQLGQCARIPAFRTFTDTRSPCRHLALHVLHEESRGADRAHHAPAPSGKAISWRVHTDTSMDRTAVLEIHRMWMSWRLFMFLCVLPLECIPGYDYAMQVCLQVVRGKAAAKQKG
jgi:hypothetical protein